MSRCGRRGAVIRPYVRVTPILEVSGVDFGLSSFPLTLKLELLQHSGSFKAQGAFANLLLRRIPEAGVAAASGGNHGAAVAYAAMRLGVRAKIFVPTVSSPAKVQRIRAYGAALAIVGDRYADALDQAIRRAQDALWSTVRIVAEPGGRQASPPSSAEPTRRGPASESASSSAAATLPRSISADSDPRDTY